MSSVRRRFEYDLIRAVAIIGVVAIHTDNITSSPTNYLGGISWWIVNTVHSAAVVSVPLFVMLSGALLLQRSQLPFEAVIKKTTKQFIWPLLFWWLVISWWQQQQIGEIWTAQDTVVPFFWSDIGHLYFLQVIVGVYLAFPRLHQVLHQYSTSWRRGIVVGWIVSSLLYQAVKFWLLGGSHGITMLDVWWPYLSYAILGYYAARVKLQPKLWWGVLVSSGALVLLISAGTFLNTLALNHGNGLGWSAVGGNIWWEPFTVPVMILSVFVFILINSIGVVWPKNINLRLGRSAIVQFSSASYGIYLLHLLVQQWLDHQLQWSVQFISYSLVVYYFQRLTATLIASWTVVWLIQKIPFVRSVFGWGRTEKKPLQRV